MYAAVVNIFNKRDHRVNRTVFYDLKMTRIMNPYRRSVLPLPHVAGLSMAVRKWMHWMMDIQGDCLSSVPAPLLYRLLRSTSSTSVPSAEGSVTVYLFIRSWSNCCGY